MLAKKFGDQVEFVFIYGREEHQTILDQFMPKAFEQSGGEGRHRAAREMRQQFNMTRRILLDDEAGSIQRRFGNNSNATFVIGVDRRLAYAQFWTQGQALEAFLKPFLRRGGVYQPDLMQKSWQAPPDFQTLSNRLKSLEHRTRPGQ